MATTPRHERTPVCLSGTEKKRLLRSPVPRAPVDLSDHANDDEAEKQKRKVDRQAASLRSPHGAGSPRKPGAGGRPGFVGDNGMSQSQLADHYASCIKLSSENKINAKNAFGLHLIDCMDEMLRQEGGLTNFQVAGCTLDASAKIYSGRVDSIYADTYKILGGLAGQERKPSERDADNDAAADGTEGNKRAGKSKKKLRHSRTVEQNTEALNVKKFDLEFEVDPLFSKTSATFDEGGPKGLLLNQLSTRGDSCDVILDSNAVVMPTAVVTETEASSSHDPKMTTDLSQLRDHLHLLRLGGLDICPDFSEFLFMEEHAGVGNTFSVHDVLASTTPSKARFQQDYRYEAGESSDENDNVGYDGPGDNDYPDMCGDGGMADDGLVEGGDVTLPVTLPVQPGDKTMIAVAGQSSCASSNLMLSVATQPNEYSYFDQQHLANWAGPRHWQLRPRSKDSSNVDGSVTAGEKTRERAKRKAFEIDFTSSLGSKQLFAQSKATLLTKGTLSKQSIAQTTLPEDLHFNINELLQLFINPKWKLVRMEVPDDDKDHGGDMPWYNYQNQRDCEEYCLPPGAVAANSGPGQHAGEEDAAGGCDFGGAGGGGDDDDDYDDAAQQAAAAGSMGSMTMDNFASLADMQMQSFLEQARGADPSMLLGDNLVAQPRKVQRIQIDYAKAAKKMDVKKLKSGIWSVLTQPGEKENTPAPEPSKDTESKDECAGTQSFSSLYGTLPHKISANMTKNLSVPIAFVCLLHLANEKNLKVAGTEGRSDLLISQDS
eukprot:scpid28676/ scgid15559/ Condensin complex subunit 2; Barren homolog; Chromosome assembly protein xCAP-H; Chromosome-associated protein H; Non-SMC condensin I complex subunit H